jgi:Rrf2 family protein
MHLAQKGAVLKGSQSQGKDLLVTRKELASVQNIPLKYLDQILIRLRSAGLVVADRGPLGGLKLAKHPQDISVWDLLRSVEEGFVPVMCLDAPDSCDYVSQCGTKRAWETIWTRLQEPLLALKLSDLCAPAALEGPMEKEKIWQSSFPILD